MAIKRRSSPDRVELKKQKTRAAEPPAELSKGAKWMIQQIDHMQQAYKEALIAAVSIIQHQSRFKSLGIKDIQTPVHLKSKLDNAWSRYEAVRRHVEWYTSQDRSQSSTSYPIIAPLPQPADTLAIAEVPVERKASPVPLAAASMLAYDHEKSTVTSNMGVVPGMETPNQQTSMTQTIQGALPGPSLPTTQYPPEGGMTFQMSDNGNSGNVDLSSMTLNELSAIMEGNSGLFSNPDGDQEGQDWSSNTVMDMFGSQTQPGNGDSIKPDFQPQPSSLGFDNSHPIDLSQSMDINTSAPVKANLTSGSGSAQETQPAPQPSGSAEVDALLASLTQSQEANGSSGLSFNFDLGDGTGDVDLSDLAGLFSSDNGNAAQQYSRPIDASGNPAAGSGGGSALTQPPNPARPASQSGQANELLLLDGTSNAGTQTAGVQGPGGAPAGGSYNVDGIDIEDFNFGDNLLPNVEGDEFETMFAEFR